MSKSEIHLIELLEKARFLLPVLQVNIPARKRMGEAIDLLIELTKDGNSMVECWLIHPADDDDCLNCPSVKDCRAVRKEIEQRDELIDRLTKQLEDCNKKIQQWQDAFRLAADTVKRNELLAELKTKSKEGAKVHLRKDSR